MSNRQDRNNELKAYLFFMGGAGDFVTGSATLLSVHQGKKITNILVDCGIFQGKGEELNWEFPINPANIHFLLLTHGHLDHCGRIPYCFKNGYMGKVYTTKGTKKQSHPIMQDCASINEKMVGITKTEKQAYRMLKKKESKKNRRAVRENEDADLTASKVLEQEYEELLSRALYTIEDAEVAYSSFMEVPVLNLIQLSNGISVKFIPNSHQNGACSIEFFLSCNGEEINIAFSGDIGPADSYLYKPIRYKANSSIKYYVMEGLHGVDKRIETSLQAEKRLIDYILKCRQEKKVAIIVAFTLDRIALAISIINNLMDAGIDLSVILDTPMGIIQTDNYFKSFELDKHIWFKDFEKNPFDTSRFKVADNHKLHMQLLDDFKPNIAISAQGMGYGGRIADYFEKYVQSEDAAFIFLGFLIEESPGHELCNAVNGELVYLNGCPYKKRCETVQICGFSGHGYLDDYLATIERYPNLDHVILNHALTTKKQELGEVIRQQKDLSISIPDMQELFCITQEGIEKIENSNLFISQNQLFS